MLQQRVVLLRPRRARAIEGTLLSIRQFSATYLQAKDYNNHSSKYATFQSPSAQFTVHVSSYFPSLNWIFSQGVVVLIQPYYDFSAPTHLFLTDEDANATEDSAASSAAGRPSAQTRRNNIPPANLNIRNVNHERPRPRRIIDARSLAASQATGQPANILKNSRARNPRGNRSTAFRGPRAGPRKKVQSKDGREGRPRRNEGSDQEDSALEAAFHEASINAVYRELAEQAQPKPVQYNPESISLASLKETWPSLPTDIHAHTAGVVEKLSLFGDRYANDYVPPNELGKRLYQGKFVRFSSEEEKAEAIMEANKLSQERADKLSQRKGDLVEPRHVNFSPLSTKDQGSLIGLLVQGNYPKSKAKQADNVSVVDSVSENLRNNATYHTVGKSSAFIAKLDSLLAASRITKRS
ncbi:hypothetical protein AAWM_07657 [Aspergillus awamori]|uniref:Uncharacterized protein n=1 Tax=Aspergillus awamori TaxID=105351 RepID=A0A401KZZ5_ASPAW|nr:hypothetical protein AAWM_07657 [Aspergillus awamori]GKZ62386.1 hypothetical protein AnigIFM49718_009473 [Aspergillus niger]GLA21443.1 hypothetical protein AnigIFM62618_010754 [Aspergillus niger]